MAERGAYRSIKVVLWDGPDFQQLPERARWVFVTLKAAFGPAGIEVHYPEALIHELAAKTGAPVDGIREALDTLDAAGWIRRERNVLWIVGQLQHEPALEASNQNHRKSIQRHVAGLPRLGIVRAFIEAHPEWFVDTDSPTDGYPMASEGVSKGIPIAPAINEERRTKNEERLTTTVSDETEGEPSVDESLGAVLAPLIREHLWLGKEPPDAGRHMGNDLSICGAILKDDSMEVEELAACIEVARSALDLPAEKPFDMRLFYAQGQRHRLNICRGEVEKRSRNPKALGAVLRRVANG